MNRAGPEATRLAEMASWRSGPAQCSRAERNRAALRPPGPRPDQATTGAALSDAVMVATVVGTRGASAHISS